MTKIKPMWSNTGAALLLTAYLCIGWADTWESLQKSADVVSSVSAEFVQEKHMKILSQPLVSRGVFFFQAPNSLRWEYRYPVRSLLLVYNGKTKRYIQRKESLVEDETANLQSMQMVVQEVTRWLNGRFDESPAFSANLAAGRKIVLAPREKALAILIRRIEINLSERPGILKSVVIYESQDSFTKLEFNNVVLNRKMEDTLFRKT